MFKKLAAFLLFFSIIGFSLVYKAPFSFLNSKISEYSSQIVQPDTPAALNIPAIGVSTKIELLGLDGENRMKSPADINKAGWYAYGFKPGEKGNAVIAGHVDSETAPALFYRLSELKKGDEVIVTDVKNRKYKFKVYKKEIYDYDNVPLELIFGAASKPYLNLITCTGIFESGTKNYLKRLVVYTGMD